MQYKKAATGNDSNRVPGLSGESISGRTSGQRFRGTALLTNQGDLVNRIMRAGNYHEKEYEVTVDKKITETFNQKDEQWCPDSGDCDTTMYGI